MTLIAGLDIGGTHMSAGLVDHEGQILNVRRTLTLAHASAEELFDEVVSLVSATLADAGTRNVSGLGVGCAGPMNADGVSPLNIPAWRDFPLGARLEKQLGLPVLVDNDAKAMASGEGWVGAARNCDNFIGIVVSTGVGGGIFLNGRLLDGRTGNAGHIGHMVVVPDGCECVCGGRGCLEAEASGTAIAAKAIERCRDGLVGEGALLERFRAIQAGNAGAQARANSRLTASDVASAANLGDRWAKAVMDEAGVALGRAIASAAALADLSLAVVGGGVANTGGLLFDPAREQIKKDANLAFVQDLKIVPASLGPDSGVVGAASLFVQGTENG